MPIFPPIARSLAGAPTKDAILEPSPLYLTGEEQLRISSLGNAAGVTLMVRGRVLRPDFDIAITEQAHTPNSNRTIATTTIALSEGWPLGFEVKASAGTPPFGAVWCLLELVRGQGAAAVAVESLGYGFVTANQPLQWPNGLNYLATDGPGQMRVIQGTTPGAGAEISETVPAGARWEVIAFSGQLVTSAAVANRVPVLTIDDGANIFFRGDSNFSQAASLTGKYHWAQGMMASMAAHIGALQAGLPGDLTLGPGCRIKTATTAIDVADQWSAVNYLVRERFDL